MVTKFDDSAEVIWVDPEATGELCSALARSNLPSLRAISGLTIVIGSGLLNGVTDPMRDPVTTIGWDALSSSTVTGGSSITLASCALALDANATAASPTPAHSIDRRFAIEI